MADDAKSDAGNVSATPGAGAPPVPVEQNIPIDSENLQPIYANFARVTGSPEELILDFGLNPSPFGNSPTPIKVSERLVMNFFTAKRLLAALSMAVSRHEQAFGVLETDVNKRVRPQGGQR